VYVTRQPDDQTRQRAADMLAVGAKPTLVSELLQRENTPVATKDVYNMRQKLKFRGKLISCKYTANFMASYCRVQEKFHFLRVTEISVNICVEIEHRYVIN